ncbi:MAG: beta strand repeat-containing protein [Acidimicrobiales bacterium]
MNNPRRIQRHLVKALAAGALLAAAALPLAIATAAGAVGATIAFTTTTPAVGAASNQPNLGSYGTTTSGSFSITAPTSTFAGSGTPTFTTTATGLTLTGTLETGSTSVVGGSFTSSAGGLAVGNYTVTVKDATDTGGTTISFSVTGAQTVSFNTSASSCGGTSDGSYFGTGACGTFLLTDTTNAPFAGDGGTTTVTTTAPGVTFSGVTNTTGDTITGGFASTSATVPGTYSITVKDNAGTETYTNDFVVYADPAVTSVTNPNTGNNTASDTSGITAITGLKLSGSGFVDPTSVVFTSTVDGTSITATAIAGGGTETAPSSSITVDLSLQNGVNSRLATPGTYTVTVENADGGSSTSGPVFTVIGNSISAVSPSAVAVSATQSTVGNLTISGGGFESGAVVTFTSCSGAFTPTATSTTVTSPSTITTQITVPAATGVEQCTVNVANSGAGDNGASYALSNGLGIGESSDSAPVITASTLSTATALLAGAPSTTITLTGTGFSPFTVAGSTLEGSNSVVDADSVITTAADSCIANSAGTSLTCPIVINSGATAGAHTATFTNDTKTGAFPSAFTVDGPSITSSKPPSLAVGTPIGTVIALTGTGFNNTSGLEGAGILGSTGLAGVLQYSSATAENLVVTTSPTAVGNATFSLQTVDSYGAAEVSAPFTLAVAAAPTVVSTTYSATGTSGVGVGATAQTVVINGTYFQSGATVTAFTNASGTADTAVTAKVVSVNNLGTQITATIAIAAPDANTVDGFTVTNPDGGVAKALAVAPAGLVIDAAPTITSVTPATGTAGATTSFAVAGTGFQAGATASLNPANGTCGAVTVTSATTVAATCTLGQPGSAATYLVITNPDGGAAQSASAVLAAKVAPKPKFHVSGVHGAAVAGRTVKITISGIGFYGQPKITSNAAGSKFAVIKDNGRLLTVKVTTRAGMHGEHVLTVRLANGKTGRAGYNIKK